MKVVAAMVAATAGVAYLGRRGHGCVGDAGEGKVVGGETW